MIRSLGLVFFCLFLFTEVRAIKAVVSHTVFYVLEPGKQGKPYLEIYWQIDPSTIHFANTGDSTWEGKIKTDIVLRDANGIVGEDHFVLQTLPATTYEQAVIQSIIDLRRYVVPAGKLEIEITLSETLFPDNTYSFKDAIQIDEPQAAPFYSGIQLLDTVFASGTKGPFHKNGNQQIPLSASFLDDNRNILHFYTELYQSNLADKNEFPLVQRISVSRKEMGSTILNMENTDTIKPASVLPFIGHFDISALPSGNYYLNAVLENSSKAIVTSRSLFFQRANKKPATNNEADTGVQQVTIIEVGKTFAGKYNGAQLRAILKMLIPISTPAEVQTINGLLRKPDETYMRYFVFNFWKGRNDADPKKAWDQYAERVKEVNKLFGIGTFPAYESERGMTYLKYGKPNERIVVENEQGSLPYEIWQYDATQKQGSAGIFLFYRPPQMVNDFRLLHSTVTGELRNTSWRNVLYVNGQNERARAEQYLTNR